MKIENNIVLYKLTRRTVIFLTLLLCAQILIFLVGNYQNFLDSNQNLILLFVCCHSIGLSVFCLITIIQAVIIYFQTKNKLMFIHVSIYFIILIFALAATIFSRSIMFVSQGMIFQG